VALTWYVALHRKRSFEPSDRAIDPEPVQDPARPANGGDCARAAQEIDWSKSDTNAILRIEDLVIGALLFPNG
jgi:hypothetical protein